MNHASPLVSVVMPMYNVEKYIEKSLHSVLAQSYQRIEVICVDDGCTDKTLELVNRFNDSRIRLISQQNRGLAGARNTGINASRGKYVALLDSDDSWHPEKIEKHVAHLEANPMVGVSYSPSLFIDEDDNPLGIGQFPKLKDVSSKDVFCRNPVGNGSAPVIRKLTLMDVAVRNLYAMSIRATYFDESLRQSEDIELWMRIALNTKWQFEGVPEPLTFYRVNSSGLSANLNKQYQSWLYAVEKNRKHHPEFFQQWFSLGKAYQLRYLSRRAVQSRNSSAAIKLAMQSLKTNMSILVEEPKKTILSVGCAFLACLPETIYGAIESMAMKSMSNRRVSL